MKKLTMKMLLRSSSIASDPNEDVAHCLEHCVMGIADRWFGESQVCTSLEEMVGCFGHWSLGAIVRGDMSKAYTSGTSIPAKRPTVEKSWECSPTFASLLCDQVRSSTAGSE